MKEADVLRMFLARRENYDVSDIQRVRGRLYSVIMAGKHYNAVVLPQSFAYYELRYHIAGQVPELVICYEHNTVLSVTCLSLRIGNLAKPYELPETITDVEAQRRGKTGSKVLLGMYLCGVRFAQQFVNELPTTSRKRYLQRAESLGKRKRGRPVSSGDHKQKTDKPSKGKRSRSTTAK